MIELVGATSAELRSGYVENYLRPIAAKLFEVRPEVQSIVMAVAQYWNDEAEDDVHDLLMPCTLPDPVWPACLHPEGNAFLADEKGLSNEYIAIRDAARLIAQERGMRFFRVDPDGLITAFAAFCSEGAHQDMAYEESYLPYAIVRRGPAGPLVEVIGKMLRPEWENRFDVGYAKPEEGNT